MPARLLYRDAQGRDAYVDIPEGGPLFLGRSTECAVRTEDAMVSRRNTKVSFTGGRFYAEDLGSANGTFVNERRVQKQQLNHADIIRCGSLQVRYVELAATAAPAPRHNTQPIKPAGEPAEIQAEPGPPSQSDDLRAELDGLRSKLEASDSELKRLRAEAVAARDELAKARRDAAQDKEELLAVSRVAEELKKLLATAREEAAAHKARLDEVGEELAARDRQLERALEDVQRTKQTMEELRNKLAELQKTKDEGWSELNDQLAQVEHLREVIAEQERILEERRVGLISLETAAKELRVEKEKVLRELVEVRGARDDLKDKLTRSETRAEALEEEHRRLARAINEGGGSGAGGDEMTRMADELRNLKVGYKKLETDLGRAHEALARAEQERKSLSDQGAHLDVERAQLLEDKKAAELARQRAEDARAKAESLRQRAEEEKQSAAAARDTALAAAEDVRRSLDRSDKRLAELSKELAQLPELRARLEAAEAAAAAHAARAVDEERDRTPPIALVADAADEDHTIDHGDHVAAIAEKERALADASRLRAEVARMSAELTALRTAPPPELASDEHRVTDQMAAVPLDGPAGVAAIRERAQEVYDGINSALSELRTAVITAKGLFSEVGPKISDEDARKALGDALVESMERTEESKGLLRTLKELVEG